MRTKIQNEFKVKFSDKDRNKGVDILALCLIKELGRNKNIPEELVRAVESQDVLHLGFVNIELTRL